jgi:hypothetical protein
LPISGPIYHAHDNPDRTSIEAVLDIIENILQATHHLSHVAKELQKVIPKRSSKQTKER